MKHRLLGCHSGGRPEQPIQVCGQPYAALLQPQLGGGEMLVLVRVAKAWHAIGRLWVDSIAKLGALANPHHGTRLKLAEYNSSESSDPAFICAIVIPVEWPDSYIR